MCLGSHSPISLEDGVVSLLGCHVDGVHLLFSRGQSKSFSVVIGTSIFFTYPAELNCRCGVDLPLVCRALEGVVSLHGPKPCLVVYLRVTNLGLRGGLGLFHGLDPLMQCPLLLSFDLNDDLFTL